MNDKIQLLRENIKKVIIGKEETIDLLMTALLAKGHVLLEDLPGTGKTKLAKSMAMSIGGSFSRIQFTPDLLPSDITGLKIFDREKNDFVLRKGPVFTNILLADEINRATPRTQSGLLECMEEKQVTIDGEKYVLEEPFLVVATQNPIETAGTFQLPEAQMDRFMMKLSMGFLSRAEEIKVLSCYKQEDPLETLTKVLEVSDIVAMQNEANEVYVHKCILEYIAAIVEGTRKDAGIVMGVSTRGSLALLKAAKAFAYIQGRNYVVPEDIKTLAVPVLAHRLALNFGYRKEADNRQKLKEILEKQAVPTEEFDKK
jgi:MoxR-like ATPase